MTQAELGALVGVSQQAMSDFTRSAGLEPGMPAGELLLAYCERLREVAAGRASADGGGLDLVQERAALAREQRIGHQIKNEVARKTYGPISLLAETLALASQAVVERFEQLPGSLRKACPDLPAAALDQVMVVIAGARTEWVERTRQLVAERVEDLLADEDAPEEEGVQP